MEDAFNLERAETAQTLDFLAFFFRYYCRKREIESYFEAKIIEIAGLDFRNTWKELFELKKMCSLRKMLINARFTEVTGEKLKKPLSFSKILNFA